MATDIGSLFGNIPAKIDAALQPLQAKVSAGTFEKDVSLDSGDKSLEVFGTPVSIGASLKAGVAVKGANDVPDQPFGDGSIKPVPNNSYASLTIDGEIHGSGSGSGTQGVLKVSANASANASFAYRHYLPVPNNALLIDAFKSLAASTTLPQLANLKTLKPGEVVDLTAAFGVDFNLKGTYGTEANISGTFKQFESLAGDLPFAIHAALAVSAAFGFSFSDTFRYTVARAGVVHDPNWVRIRLAREKKDRISFALAINLAIDYDFTAGAKILLDKVFALVPTPQALQTLKDLADLPSDFNALKGAISDKAAEVLGRLFNNPKWKELAASEEIEKLVAGAKQVVTLYKGIDEKVQSIVEELVSKLDDDGLAQLKPVIDQVASLDLTNVEATLTSLLTEQQQKVVHWVEVLSGRSIEELVITGKAKDALTRAKTLATQLQKFLSGDAAAKEALKAINTLLTKSGVAGLVAWLDKNATSVAQLQQAAEDMVRRLVGKALDQINASDVKRLQTLSADLKKVLDAPAELHKKLENGINNLKGTLGFNVAVELSRVSESSAVIDIELDPDNASVVAAVKHNLAAGAVGDFLADLNVIKPKNADTNPEYPYFIREVILKSRHVRTSAASTVVGFLKFSLKEQESSIAESTITITGGGSANPKRQAIYSGGASVTRSDGSFTAEGAAFIRVEASGDGTDVKAPYNINVTPSLRLTYAREDSKTTKSDVESLRLLLFDFGLIAETAPVTIHDLENQQTKFAMALDFPDTAVAALLKDLKKDDLWAKDAVNAAHRWFRDPDRVNSDDTEAGPQMSEIVVTPSFRRHWTEFSSSGPLDGLFKADQNNEFGFQIFQHASGHEKDIKRQYIALVPLLRFNRFAAKGFSGFDANPGSRNPGDLTTAASKSARLFTTMQTQWQPPLFNFWLVLARLMRANPAAVSGGRGLITLRARPNSDAEWKPVMDPIVLTSIDATSLKKRFFPVV